MIGWKIKFMDRHNMCVMSLCKAGFTQTYGSPLIFAVNSRHASHGVNSPSRRPVGCSPPQSPFTICFWRTPVHAATLQCWRHCRIWRAVCSRVARNGWDDSLQPAWLVLALVSSLLNCTYKLWFSPISFWQLGILCTDLFSLPGKAIGPVCVCLSVCDLSPRCLAWRFILTLSRSSSKLKVIGSRSEVKMSIF